jgi:hypothetical protein
MILDAGQLENLRITFSFVKSSWSMFAKSPYRLPLRALIFCALSIAFAATTDAQDSSATNSVKSSQNSPTIAPSISVSDAVAQDQNRRGHAVEYTFIKANLGQREALKASIIANWFAMDDIAIARGQMAAYELFESDEDPAWDVVVAVTYKNAGGYAAIASEFEKIRKVHKSVLIDGKQFRDLGRIVMSRKLYSRYGDNTRDKPVIFK